jgi:PAS domain S-box-containing protein
VSSRLKAEIAEDNERENPTLERRNLADALAHERNVLRTMIDLIPAFIYAKDAHSRFTACNKMVASRMGTTPEDAIGKTDFDFYPRELAEKFFADEQALLKSGQPLLDCEEAGLDNVTGMVRVIVTSKIPLHDANGKVTGIVGTGFDITERKAAEERMASSDRLESIGRLAAGVAHEINTPIQFLNDTVSFVREGVQELLDYIEKLHGQLPQKPEDSDDVDYLRQELPPAMTRMADGLSRISVIVRSMKNYSHNADQQAMGEVDLNAAIESTLVIARSEYKDCADLETVFGDIPRVICHGGQVNQVVLNLVVNSAHAIHDMVKKNGGRGKITVKTEVQGNHVVISISDTGGGIPEGIQARIFDPFFTTKEVGQGSGLGLSIVHGIVERHGGTIEVESDVGKGTTFVLTLPVVHAEKKSA